ncbi:MAG: MFS transporter [gamma proteobacterium symbiont of Bathyaustriella thionipta]|nr:MFS transporter [gamma proteobacterium symbiont of Bathyaustriella thionipta]
MLGLFLILPVFAVYAEGLEGVTPLLVGIAIGVYGLTQAILQIPAGLLSDRIGRKPVIIGGLLLFAAGSLVAGLAHDIGWIIAGRAIQGSGAIAAAVMALAADLTREQQRTKTMAIIGMSIGLSFVLALVAGPLIDRWIGVPGIFLLTAVLALTAIALLVFVVPTPQKSQLHADAETVPGQLIKVLKNTQLLRLDAGILLLHLLLTAVFVSVPGVLVKQHHFHVHDHWMLYLPILVLSIASMVPFIILAESRQKMKPVFVGAVAVLMLSMLLLNQGSHSWLLLLLALWLFFTAFNLLEATLPSLVSKVAPASNKGTAMGVYSSSQFFGAFLGGLIGGAALQYFSASGVFAIGAGIAALWLLIALGMQPPAYLKSITVRLLPSNKPLDEQLNELQQMEGVKEAVVLEDKAVVYLKVDSKILNQDRLDQIAAG